MSKCAVENLIVGGDVCKEGNMVIRCGLCKVNSVTSVGDEPIENLPVVLPLIEDNEEGVLKAGDSKFSDEEGEMPNFCSRGSGVAASVAEGVPLSPLESRSEKIDLEACLRSD